MNYYIADCHFFHRSIIDMDKRHFESVEEMNDIMIERWNNAVKNEDVVYILGDLTCRATQEQVNTLLQELRGNKFLITGNHDKINFSKDAKRYGKIIGVADYKEVKEGDKHIVLSHYPMLFYHGSHRKNYWMFCGHVHNNTEEAKELEYFRRIMKERGQNAQIVNCGAMMPYMDYTPQTFDYLSNL